MKKKALLKISVGIPALNEEANIGFLIENILNQDKNNFILKEILVFSDGSTDNTNKIVKSFSSKVRLIKSKQRAGQQFAQNTISTQAKGEIVVFIEADTLPENSQVLQKLVAPYYLNPEIGMVVGEARPLSSRTIYGKLINASYRFKKRMFYRIQGGINVYTCEGHAMKAVSKQVFKKIQWPLDVPEDAFIYLYMRKTGMEIIKASNAIAYISNVQNIRDRIRQTRKFISGRKSLLKHFSEEFVNGEYNIPGRIFLKHLLSEFIQNPIVTIFCLSEILFNRIFSFSLKQYDQLYVPYYSTKELRYEQ